jgi:hypothetical protein
MFSIIHSVAERTHGITRCMMISSPLPPRILKYTTRLPPPFATLTTFMYKTKHDQGSPNFNLNTPKIPPKALPQSPPLMSPHSFNMGEHRSLTILKSSLPSSMSRAPTPKPSTPQPLKSCLKGKTSPSRDSYESDGEVTAKKGSRNSVYTVAPNSLPQHAHLGESLVQLMLFSYHYVPYLIFDLIKVP